MWKLCALILMALALMTSVSGAEAQQVVDKAQGESRGYTFYESYTGSSNSFGQVYKLNSTLGYNFNKHFEIDAGVPVYFVQASNASPSNGFTSGNGLGNAYTDLRLTFNNPVLDYASVLTVTAPTGDESRGLSTGRATFDWTNHFDRSFPLVRLTPFVNFGIANTVSDTHFFVRPFTSLGTVTHMEGGATLKLFPMIRVGASAYNIIPTGQQKVFSKLIPRGMGAPPGRGRAAFANAYETVGGPGLVSDNGASAWIAAKVGRYADLEAGYTRSVSYRLDTFEFGIGFDVAHIVRRAHGR
jgi:opacity protein-like surface antigen